MATTYEREFATHPLEAVQEHLSEASLQVQRAIEKARRANVDGLAPLFELREVLDAQIERFKRVWEGSI
jgi:hypothetical protein